MIIYTKTNEELQFAEDVTMEDIQGRNMEAVWTDGNNDKYFLKWFVGDDLNRPTVIAKLED